MSLTQFVNNPHGRYPRISVKNLIELHSYLAFVCPHSSETQLCHSMFILFIPNLFSPIHFLERLEQDICTYTHGNISETTEDKLRILDRPTTFKDTLYDESPQHRKNRDRPSMTKNKEQAVEFLANLLKDIKNELSYSIDIASPFLDQVVTQWHSSAKRCQQLLNERNQEFETISKRSKEDQLSFHRTLNPLHESQSKGCMNSTISTSSPSDTSAPPVALKNPEQISEEENSNNQDNEEEENKKAIDNNNQRRSL